MVPSPFSGEGVIKIIENNFYDRRGTTPKSQTQSLLNIPAPPTKSFRQNHFRHMLNNSALP